MKGSVRNEFLSLEALSVRQTTNTGEALVAHIFEGMLYSQLSKAGFQKTLRGVVPRRSYAGPLQVQELFAWRRGYLSAYGSILRCASPTCHLNHEG